MQAPVSLDPRVLENYRALLLPRVIEEKMLLLIRQGRISKWFSGFGQEAVAVGCALALKETDYILPLHRNTGVWTTRGVPLKPLFCQLMGRAGGFTNGRDRTYHFGLPQKRIIGMISQLGAMLPVACGLAQAAQYKGERDVAAVFVGDGATREGDFHEAMNLAAVWKLPVIFIVENNGYGLSTPTGEAMSVTDIADAAPGYGMSCATVDGNDLNAVMSAVDAAARTGRTGNGPTLLEMKTFRMRGHEEASGTKYVPPELFEQWARHDPVERYERYISEAFDVDIEELSFVRRELEARVGEVAEFALVQPQVESTLEAEQNAVFAKSDKLVRVPDGPVTNKRFIDAISEGLLQAMDGDDRVLIMGQDIAEYGGVF
ncbi:MAG: dehydrogenase, partial [Rhodothermales bacterium]|nr:dehydrogenase [Rhodothermales bacterium]